MSLRDSRQTEAGRIVRALLHWFSANARDLPWRRTQDPYAIWVSEIMLQQTQVKTVIPYWERWMRELPTIQAAAKASPAKLHKLWEGLGYYTRVRNLQKAVRQITARSRSRRREEAESSSSATSSASSPRRLQGCKFPHSFDDILALPGIGRYTAGAICSIAFNQPTPILDGNVIRVLTRIFGIATDPREKKTNAHLWQLAEVLVTHAARRDFSRSSRREEAHSKRRKGQSLLTSAATATKSCSALNQSLMELGALICTPRTPQCDVCPVNKLCVAWKKNLQEQLPNLGKREVATKRHFIAFVVERGNKFLVRQRPAGVVNAHLWEFPNVEVSATEGRARHSVRAVFPQLKNGDQRTDAPYQQEDFHVTSTKPLCTIKHSITRYRITLEAWRAEFVSRRTGVPVSDPVPRMENARNTPIRRSALRGKWLTLRQLHKLAFTSAHKKILARIGTPIS